MRLYFWRDRHSRSRETNEEVIIVVHESDYGHIVRLDPTGFAEGFGVECERYANKDFGLSN